MNQESKLRLNSGNAMPVMGLGTWQLNDDTPRAIDIALGLGYRMIDTSGDYGTQAGIADGLKRHNAKRDDFYIVTKVEEDDDAYETAKQNLRELRLDYADMILIHRPPMDGAGEQLWEGLIKARSDGLTKDIGVSNYSIDLMRALIDYSQEVPAVNQIEWTPFGHSAEMLEYCDQEGILIQAYSPLTRGQRLDYGVLGDLSSKYLKTPAQVLIRWNLQLGTVPLPKANRVEHMEENLDVFDFEIESGDMENLERLNEGYSSLMSTLPYMRQLDITGARKA